VPVRRIGAYRHKKNLRVYIGVGLQIIESGILKSAVSYISWC